MNRYINTKPITAERMGPSSGTSAVEKVLMGEGREKGIERKIRVRAIRLLHRLRT